MSKKTIALIIALFTITVVLIILAVFPVTQKTSVSITPTPSINSSAETVLSFAPPVLSTASAVSSASASYSIDATILTGTNNVNAVQLELSYDPEALFDVDIAPGDFFTNPSVLLKNIDEETGRISYALATAVGQTGKQGNGTIAILTFKSKAQAEETTITFLPKTQVAADGIQTSVLKTTISATIFGGTSSATLNH